MEAEREEEEREAKERKTEGGTLSEATVDRSPTPSILHITSSHLSVQSSARPAASAVSDSRQVVGPRQRHYRRRTQRTVRRRSI